MIEEPNENFEEITIDAILIERASIMQRNICPGCRDDVDNHNEEWGCLAPEDEYGPEPDIKCPCLLGTTNLADIFRYWQLQAPIMAELKGDS